MLTLMLLLHLTPWGRCESLYILKLRKMWKSLYPEVECWVDICSRCLNRIGYQSMVLHGEGGEMSTEDTRERREAFRLDRKIWYITVDRAYNADHQTGLFHRKLPCRTYCSESQRRDMRGVRQMKDKEGITLMVCTSAAGAKLPLAMMGTAKKL